MPKEHAFSLFTVILSAGLAERRIDAKRFKPSSSYEKLSGGRELEEGSQFYRRMPQAATNVQSFFSILLGSFGARFD